MFKRICLTLTKNPTIIKESQNMYVSGDEMEPMDHLEEISGDYVAVKALEDGVTIIGLTRGKDTRFHHTEKLDRGEVMIFQFTEHTSAMKIRGRAEIFTKHGPIKSGKDIE